jgi:putative endonuclease
MPRTYFVYILASDSHELYIGVTNHLARRIQEHRASLSQDSYTTKHRTMRLVYLESTNEVLAVIRREKQLKGWTRRKKVALIEEANPEWRDLTEDW